MFFKKKKKSEVETQNTMQQAGFSEADLELTDEEFFLAEEIDGYSYCEGMNEARCSSECFKAVMMPREAQEVIGLLKMTCREFNQTVVLVTHEKEIADMADQVIFLKDGKIADMERRQKNYVRKKICNDKKTGKSEYYRT